MGNSKSSADESNHQYQAPRPNDSRSPCPALNALANHGYLPRDGKNIPPNVLQRALQVDLIDTLKKLIIIFIFILGKNGSKLVSIKNDYSTSI